MMGLTKRWGLGCASYVPGASPANSMTLRPVRGGWPAIVCMCEVCLSLSPAHDGKLPMAQTVMSSAQFSPAGIMTGVQDILKKEAFRDLGLSWTLKFRDGIGYPSGTGGGVTHNRVGEPRLRAGAVAPAPTSRGANAG